MRFKKSSAPLHATARTGSQETGRERYSNYIRYKMSRIYHNTYLQNKPVHHEKFDGFWSPSTYESGQGVLLEGKLLDVTRHAICDVKNQKARFYVLYIKPSRIYQRKFDASGREIEPNFSGTKIVNTGFLMSSYTNRRLEYRDSAAQGQNKNGRNTVARHTDRVGPAKEAEVAAKGESDHLSQEQLSAMVNKAELVKITDEHQPSGTCAFWYPEPEMDKTELERGQDIRLKTRGNSPFIFSIAKVDSGTVTKCNFAGDEKAGASWTDKIMANKTDTSSTRKSGGEGEGAEEDEWDE